MSFLITLIKANGMKCFINALLLTSIVQFLFSLIETLCCKCFNLLLHGLQIIYIIKAIH
jgi:hypothetical protein